jgi:integrase
LQNIFTNVGIKATTAWQYWIPIIALYTGGRISEIANLKTEHFNNQIGIETMHMPGSKTDAAPRDVPIHADLILIGLLKLVEKRRKQGKKMLFDLPLGGTNGAGGHTSNYFTEFKRSIGITHEKKVFHSFRHTVNDLMRQALMNESAKLTYIGHSLGQSVNVKTYGKTQLAVSILKSEITDKMDWQKYCGWSPDIASMDTKAAELLKS